MIFQESFRFALRRDSRQSQNSSRVPGCLLSPTWLCSLRVSHIRFIRLRQAWWIGESIPFSASVLSYTDMLSSLPSVVGIAGSKVYLYCQFAGGETKKSGVEETFLKSRCLYSVNGGSFSEEFRSYGFRHRPTTRKSVSHCLLD